MTALVIIGITGAALSFVIPLAMIWEGNSLKRPGTDD